MSEILFDHGDCKSETCESWKLLDSNDSKTNASLHNVIIIIVWNLTATKFSVNRCALEISSPVFREMFQRLPENGNHYEIRNISPEQFKILCEYMFLESSWAYTNLADSLSLLEAAGRFGLFGFQMEIFEQLRTFVSAEQDFSDHEVLFKAFNLFREFDHDKGLLKEAREYICKNAIKLLEGFAFLYLQAEDFADILASDVLVVKSELQIFKAVLRWGVHAVKSRRNLLTEENIWEVTAPLFEYIRFGNLKVTEFLQYVLPLSILPQEAISTYTAENKKQDRPRNYRMNPFLSFDIKTRTPEEEAARAEQFIRSFEHERKFHNDQMEIVWMEAVRNQQQLQERIERQQEDINAEKSNTEYITHKFEYQASQLKAFQKTVGELRADLLKMTEYARLKIDKKFLRALRFENTKNTAVTFIVENLTLVPLQLYSHIGYGNHWANTISEKQFEYERMDQEISPNKWGTFGFTSPDECNGILGYYLYGFIFLIKYYVYERRNFVSLAICPRDFANMREMFLAMGSDENWAGHTDRVFAMENTKELTKRKELGINIQLGNLTATATMRTGSKATVNVKIFEDAAVSAEE